MQPNGYRAALRQADPLGVVSRNATLLPSCTLAIDLTLAAAALGATPAAVIAQDPRLGARGPAVLLQKCHRGKLEPQPA